jgi:hypothetical protein
LFHFKAGPRDVVDIHTTALKEKTKMVNLAKAQAYVTVRFRVPDGTRKINGFGNDGLFDFILSQILFRIK